MCMSELNYENCHYEEGEGSDSIISIEVFCLFVSSCKGKQQHE